MAKSGAGKPTHKRPYRAPRLSVYGFLKDLTAGGTGMSSENMVQMEATRKV